MRVWVRKIIFYFNIFNKMTRYFENVIKNFRLSLLSHDPQKFFKFKKKKKNTKKNEKTRHDHGTVTARSRHDHGTVTAKTITAPPRAQSRYFHCMMDIEKKMIV